MLQEFAAAGNKNTFPEQERIMGGLPGVYGNGIPCDQVECIYCLNNHYCCRAWPPRNTDGYCKNFISIND
ncbi:MAG: hypothetical protein PWP70_305 [Moorella sp. (in: firmicutes)]|nr:hypothetical protein [Moorella sp. (in: firmicutes)]